MGVEIKPDFDIKTLSKKTLKDVEKLKFAFYQWYDLEKKAVNAETDASRQVKGSGRLLRLSHLCDLMNLVNYLTINAKYSYEEEIDD